MEQTLDDYDSPWKDVLRRLFPQFLEFFFPAVYAAVDWTQRPEFLDKELQKSVPEAVTGKRTVDALVKVRMLAGVVQWLFIHIEVQSQVDPKFAERMFIYAYRLYDRFQQLVVSLAVLGDDSPNWRPAEFALSSLTSAISFRFEMVKLLDYSARSDELAANSNPFALVVMAHRQAVKTDQNSMVRVDAKIELARLLGLRRYSETETQELFRFIDWLLQLSATTKPLYDARIAALKEQEPMTYLSTIERDARAEGLLVGLEVGLKLMYGDAGLALLPAIREITDPDMLEKLLHTLAECGSLAEFQHAMPQV